MNNFDCVQEYGKYCRKINGMDMQELESEKFSLEYIQMITLNRKWMYRERGAIDFPVEDITLKEGRQKLGYVDRAITLLERDLKKEVENKESDYGQLRDLEERTITDLKLEKSGLDSLNCLGNTSEVNEARRKRYAFICQAIANKERAEKEMLNEL